VPLIFNKFSKNELRDWLFIGHVKNIHFGVNHLFMPVRSPGLVQNLYDLILMQLLGVFFRKSRKDSGWCHSIIPKTVLQIYFSPCVSSAYSMFNGVIFREFWVFYFQHPLQMMLFKIKLSLALQNIPKHALMNVREWHQNI
jgi:hypothetical protein